MTPSTETQPRARALAPEQRRQTLVDATLRLIHERRRVPSTRHIAEAAGVAEGTVFRAFGTKDELIDAAAAQAFDPAPFAERVAQIDPGLPLRERVLALVVCLQDRFQSVFGVMEALRMSSPPTEHQPSARPGRHHLVSEQCLDVIRGDADALRITPERFMAVIRLLTFSGSHPMISHGNPLTPEEITGVLLDGVLTEKEDS